MNALPQGCILHGKAYDYEIRHMLGQGSFGITYLAKIKLTGALGSIDSNAMVAIKEFFMKDLNGRSGTTVTNGDSRGGLCDNYKRKFASEAQNLARLEHPGIIKVLELFEANSTVYYAMEYIGGGSLNDHIEASGGLTEADGIRLIRQIGNALAYMHAHKVLHLDLKPSNIMLRKDGRAVLIDFGLSKQYDENGLPESSTTIGGGTPGYAPLEQSHYREGRSFPATMDVYALGATLFKMLTGERPPEAADLLNEGFSTQDLQRKGISARTIACIAKAMEPVKAQRYPNVAAFMQGLSADDEETVFGGRGGFDAGSTPVEETEIVADPVVPAPGSNGRRSSSLLAEYGKSVLFGIALVVGICIGLLLFRNRSTGFVPLTVVDSLQYDTATVTVPSMPAPPKPVNSPKSREVRKPVTVSTDNGPSAQELIAQSQRLEEEKKQTAFQIEMIRVVGGTFIMGGTEEQGVEVDDDEKPAHRVTVSDFSIGKYEVTQKQWKAVMGTNPSRFKGDNLPVENVSWNDAQEFIRELNARTGKNYRLPTEAEWEFAARGGNNSRGYKYSGSDNIDAVAWYTGNSCNSTHPVGTKAPNELGIYNMSGNVWEWCQDWYGSYAEDAQSNPQGPSSGEGCVLRGGSWSSYARYGRVSFRNSFPPSSWEGLNSGFRLVLAH